MSPVAHIKARCPVYPGSDTRRFSVPDDKVDWEIDWPQYNPVNYTAPAVLKKPVWADPEIGCVTNKYVNHTMSNEKKSNKYFIC